jgi:hypothetical protein
MRRPFVLAVLALVLLAACREGPPLAPSSSSSSSSTPGRCAPPAHYLAAGRPDPCLSPGQARTADPSVICTPGTARAARAELSASQWAKRRRVVEQRYGLSANPGEIDHLLPLEGGGSNALGNLWPESPPQFGEKDRAEGALHRAICVPGTTPATIRRLQAVFLARWGGGS